MGITKLARIVTITKDVIFSANDNETYVIERNVSL